MECPAYLGEHVHLGCSLNGLSLLPYHFYVIVTGTSQKAEVQFFDAKLNTKLIGEEMKTCVRGRDTGVSGQ